MARYCYRAPTKVILVGEHFVVKSVPGVAAAISLWSYACASPTSGSGRIVARSLGVECKLGECGRHGLAGLEEMLMRLPGSVELEVWSEAPPGAGLGSSGSVAVAAAAAALHALRGRVSEEEVEELAWVAERVHHGRPSGIDHMTALYGGVVVLETRGVYRRIEPKVKPLLVLADTGVPRRTRDAIEAVLSRYARLTGPLSLIYLAAARLTEEAVRALLEARLERLGEIMDVAHGLLYAIGVSTPEIERLVWAARRAGALGAKLTGAGMGGVVVALASDTSSAERIATALKAAGAKWVRVAEGGVNGLQPYQPQG